MDERQPFEDIAAAGSPATPDALRSIVARHQRARTRTLGVALAVALVAGPVAGWAIGHSGGGGQQVATKAQPDLANGNGGSAANAPTAAGGGASSQAIAYPDRNPPKATHLFNRTSSDGIAIRAYRIDPPPQPAVSPTTTPSTKTQEAPCPVPPPGGPETGTATANANSGATASASASSGSSSGSSGGGQAISSPPAPAPPPGAVISGTPPPCGPMPPPCPSPSPTVHAEVSNDAAVGESMDSIDNKQPADPLSHLSVGMFGVPENSSALIVTVQTGPGVATVRLRLPSGATDEMAPIGNIAVLAHASDAPPPSGVVEALDGSGKVLGSQSLAPSGPTTAIACAFSGGTVRAKPMPAPATPPTTR